MAPTPALGFGSDEPNKKPLRGFPSQLRRLSFGANIKGKSPCLLQFCRWSDTDDAPLSSL
jgi:hypothetical protein